MNHPDFRIGVKVFATLGYPDESWAMVKLTPEERAFVEDAPLVFRACNGVWGQRGATNVHLVSADTPLVQGGAVPFTRVHHLQRLQGWRFDG